MEEQAALSQETKDFYHWQITSHAEQFKMVNEIRVGSSVADPYRSFAPLAPQFVRIDLFIPNKGVLFKIFENCHTFL